MAQVAVPLGKHGTVFSRDNRDSSISCNVISMLSARIDRLLSPLRLVKSVSTDPAMLLQLLLVEFHGPIWTKVKRTGLWYQSQLRGRIGMNL